MPTAALAQGEPATAAPEAAVPADALAEEVPATASPQAAAAAPLC